MILGTELGSFDGALLGLELGVFDGAELGMVLGILDRLGLADGFILGIRVG